MSRQFFANSWGQIALGVFMLVGIALPVLISLANTIGLRKATMKVVIGLLIAIWVMAGVVLIVRGLNRM